MQNDVANLVKGDTWKRIKRNLLQKLSNLDSVKTIRKDDAGNKRSPDEIMNQIEVRSLVIDIILDWLDEIEGDANQGESNKDALKEVQKDDYIIDLEAKEE